LVTGGKIKAGEVNSLLRMRREVLRKCKEKMQKCRNARMQKCRNEG
jgi:hypothetical protein